jgi:predicted Zn-dependent protease with MMP-like domain
VAGSEFDLQVKRAIAKIPPRIRAAMANVAIVVDEWPDPDMVEEATGERDELLYGLFTGTPIAERSVHSSGDLPDVIHLFRGPLEEDFPNPDDLAREIEITLVHEIAHFMGFDDETLEAYGYG